MKTLLTIAVGIVLAASGWTQQTQGFIGIHEGRLYYEQTGKGPPLLFLHGVCLDHRMWQQQVTYFSKSYTCITIDLRGFGKSSVPNTTPYSFHEDLTILLDSLHIKGPIVLIALSMGGKAAVNFALAYPERTKALILADVAIDGYVFKDFKLDRIAKLGREKGIDSANQAFLEDPIFASARGDSTVFKQLREMILSYSGWQWSHPNPIHGLSPPALEQLNHISVPTLIITGEKDLPDFQQLAEILHKNINHSLLKHIHYAGHMCNMEKPVAFNRLLSDFLNNVTN